MYAIAPSPGTYVVYGSSEILANNNEPFGSTGNSGATDGVPSTNWKLPSFVNINLSFLLLIPALLKKYCGSLVRIIIGFISLFCKVKWAKSPKIL